MQGVSQAVDGKDRSKYLGGSDAAAVLGVSPWRSAYRLWCEKSGGEMPPDLSLKSWIEWGNRLEPVVAEAFSERTGLKIRVEPRFLVHRSPRYRYMGGHIDRRILNSNAFLECKTTNAYDNRMWGDEEQGHAGVPLHYLAQCDHYLSVGNFEHCYISVLIGGNDLRTYHIERDAKREAALLAASSAFWKLVVTGEMPPIQSEADAKHRWRSVLEGTSVEVDDAVLSKVRTLALVQARIKQAEAQEKVLRDELFPLFGEHQALSRDGNRIAQLSAYPREYFDKGAFEAKHPKIAAKFTSSRTSKRLKVLV